jgi:hypothetical protein
MASAIRGQEGDFRNWAEIREWATSVADTRFLHDGRLRRPARPRFPPARSPCSAKAAVLATAFKAAEAP